jgi:HD-GYP domain-containing protein (c-di-GMP phosphodiesterase class II)
MNVMTRRRIELILQLAFPPDREPQAFQAAANEVVQAYKSPSFFAGAHDLFEGRWSAEYAVLMVALTRGQITRCLLGVRPVAWPDLVAAVFSAPRKKPTDAEPLRPQFALNLMETHLVSTTLEDQLSHLLGHLAVVGALLAALRRHDPQSFGHSERVARAAMIVARRMGHEDPALVYLAGLSHDVGKCFVRRRVLRKPAALTAAEAAHMKRHVEAGEAVLGAIPGLPRALLRGCAEHHERLDGSGYPRGLRGSELSVEGRILAVADVWEAMASPRCYRPARTVAEIDRVFGEGSGDHFDPEAVEAFVAGRREIEALTFVDRMQVVA